MPHHPEDTRYPHLPLVREDTEYDRRRRTGWAGQRPDRGGRAAFAAQLLQQVQRIQQTVAATPAGIRPHLVFKVPISDDGATAAVAEKLQQAGLTVVDVEPNRAIVVFRDDANLREFQAAVQTYQQGPRTGINRQTNRPFESTTWDVLEYIEADQMQVWSRADRVGKRLGQEIGRLGDQIGRDAQYKVDVELWHPGSRARARQEVDELERFLHSQGTQQRNRILDQYIGDALCLVRLVADGRVINQILDAPIIAEMERPPLPTFDTALAYRLTGANFPATVQPPADGPRLCILDTGVTSNHPLLRQNVGYEAAVFTAQTSPSDMHGHGTMVGGLAVFGDIRACVTSGRFASPIVLFSARVLNDQNQFDDEKLVITQIRTAIEMFKAAPYNCRVFNLSIGTDGPAFESEQRQTLWAEQMDILARELKVLLVVSAGNVDPTRDRTAEETLQQYPGYLQGADASLNDPATAALAITVGALCQEDVPAVRQGANRDDIVRTLAQRNQPSPFTRSGMGLNGAIKPEFVDYGGNLVFEGFGGVRRIGKEPGTAVMSFSRAPTETLFAYNFGTSFAAPRVARIAAIVWKRLDQQLGEGDHGNLVRALLATAASVPEEARTLLSTLGGEEAVLRTCGYGLIDEDLAVSSGNRRVTMVAEGQITLDRFIVFRVPIPDQFYDAEGAKRITVGLAYDPPVRRRRQDYIGVEMNFDLIRGTTLDQVIAAYRRVGPGEEASSIDQSSRVNLRPVSQPRGGLFSRKRSTLQSGTARFTRFQRTYGDAYWLVLRAERKWAPPEITVQDFGVAVSVQADAPELYTQISQRIRQRIRARG
jgi:hypothetical protein